ncbi:MAG TPA: sucrase ferredoxin, partial [Acidimicrobiales bacterium]|nr:sucrase ferredoxin [Acidimicrobiales bacterium]
EETTAGTPPAGTTAGPPTHDVLVCTHGARDRCCGSLGTGLALPLLADPDALGPGVRVWRTSHTGGHRFAPTALVFPGGTAWAYADVDLLRRVVDRQDVGAAVAHYRGCAGMATPRLQALERAVLGRVGWGLLDRPRSGDDDGGPTVRLGVDDPAEVWEAEVAVGRRLPVPPCGAPIGAATKSDNEWAVSGLRLVTSGPSSERMAI